jgi:hypothetical protein
MIRLVTYRNFPLRDMQMEQAYRRRRVAGEIIILQEINEIAIGASSGESRRRKGRSHDWLRRLARAVDALATHPETPVRRCGLVAANSSGEPRHGKRRQRNSRS